MAIIEMIQSTQNFIGKTYIKVTEIQQQEILTTTKSYKKIEFIVKLHKNSVKMEYGIPVSYFDIFAKHMVKKDHVGKALSNMESPVAFLKLEYFEELCRFIKSKMDQDPSLDWLIFDVQKLNLRDLDKTPDLQMVSHCIDNVFHNMPITIHLKEWQPDFSIFAG